MGILTINTPSPSASASSVWWHQQLQLDDSATSSPCSPASAVSSRLCMSTSTGGTHSSAPTSDSLLNAIASGQEAVVAEMVVACSAAKVWPVSPAACLFAAVKLRQNLVVARLLAAGAPAQFLVAELTRPDLFALSCAGISADGVGHMSPLVIAVRQQNLPVAKMLLRRGGRAEITVAGMPLLLHFNEALMPAASPSCSGGGGSSSAGACATSAVSSQLQPAPSSSSGVLSLVQDLEEKLQMLWLLMQYGADPLQSCLSRPPHSFLTDCNHPALLRLAVNYVRHQCEHGRQLSSMEAQHVLAAAIRAVRGGF